MLQVRSTILLLLEFAAWAWLCNDALIFDCRDVAGQGAKQNARSWKPVAVEKKGCGRYVVIMCVQNES